MKLKWPWHRQKESEETKELRERFRQAERDDARIEELNRRTRKLVVDNHLAEDIRRALGARP